MIIKAKLGKRLFPKSYDEEKFLYYTIASMEVLEMIEGEREDLKLHDIYNTLTFKGNAPKMEKGVIYEIKLGETEESKFGTSYQSQYVNRLFGKDMSEDDEVMMHGIYYSTSTDIADRIMEDYSIKEFVEIVENNEFEALEKVRGIGKVYSRKIVRKMKEYLENGYEYNKVLIKLSKYGLSMEEIKLLCELLCSEEKISYEPILEFLVKTPYDLVLKNILGFKRTDEIAKAFGNCDVLARTEALIVETLRIQAESGKSFLMMNQYNSIIYKYVKGDTNITKEALLNLHAKKYVLYNEQNQVVCLKEYYNLERDIAKRLVELSYAEPYVKSYDGWEDKIRELEVEQGWNYTDEQMEGIRTCMSKNVVLITGLAGTGKTTVTNGINRVFDKLPITLCALSGKASQRMSQVTGLPASTIFKVLMNQEKSPINEVDESTMINGQTFLKLLNNIDTGSKVFILGDVGQLQSIGSCNVFADILNSGVIPVVNLTKIHRQAQKSAIVTGSTGLRKAIPLVPAGFYGEETMGELQDLTVCCPRDLFKETIDKFFESLKHHDILESQIITPLKDKGELSCLSLNNAIQETYNPNCRDGYVYLSNTTYTFFEGDKVINKKNNYNVSKAENLEENVAVMNGNIGIVKSIDVENNEMIIDFQFIGEVVFDREKIQNLDLGYAITVHKSQGSQWEFLIALLGKDSPMMNKNEMLYTAITRASKKCIVISESGILQLCATQFEQKTKQTLLLPFLKECQIAWLRKKEEKEKCAKDSTVKVLEE